MNRPKCAVLLDEHVRRVAMTYSKLGYVGVVITEMLAYIALLEEEKCDKEGTD